MIGYDMLYRTNILVRYFPLELEVGPCITYILVTFALGTLVLADLILRFPLQFSFSRLCVASRMVI